jgi:hypothetical protein
VTQSWVNPHTFVGYQARDGFTLAFLESLTGPDGKTVKI